MIRLLIVRICFNCSANKHTNLSVPLVLDSCSASACLDGQLNVYRGVPVVDGHLRYYQGLSLVC